MIHFFVQLNILKVCVLLFVMLRLLNIFKLADILIAESTKYFANIMHCTSIIFKRLTTTRVYPALFLKVWALPVFLLVLYLPFIHYKPMQKDAIKSNGN